MGIKLGLILRKEHRLRVFENRVLRRIFGHKREEVAGEDCIMGSLNNLYSSPNKVGRCSLVASDSGWGTSGRLL
jgi:hypothetical protein